MPNPPANALRLLREGHEERVLGLLRTQGALSRADLARMTGLSRATLSSIIGQLLDAEAVIETMGEQTSQRGRGRPPTFVTLNPASGLAVGIGLGYRRIHVSIANVAHDIIATSAADCAETATWRQRVDVALSLIEAKIARLHISLSALEGVGVGVIGPVAEAGLLPNPHDFDRAKGLHELVEERLGVPSYVDNNCRLGALAEAIWGAAAGSENVLYIRLSHGVGGGLILGGHMMSGAFGGAGEIGHVSVEPDGPPCDCGSRGCLERYIGLAEIFEQSRVGSLEELLRQLRAGDDDVKAVIRDAGWRLGRVVAGVCNVVDPEIVVVGGELADAGSALLDPAREAIAVYGHRQGRGRLRIQRSDLGERVTALGGIALVLHRSAVLAGYPAARQPRTDLPPTERHSSEDAELAL